MLRTLLLSVVERIKDGWRGIRGERRGTKGEGKASGSGGWAELNSIWIW